MTNSHWKPDQPTMMPTTHHHHPPQPPLIQGLLRSDAYPHPVTEIRLIETHISWLLLTGDIAYKLKKPVDLGFLDFSTLAKREQACHEELRLNRRLAPDLYIDVVTLTGTPKLPTINGDGSIIDYAVRMKQFDPAMGLDALLERDELRPELLDELAVMVAEFHQSIPRADLDSPWGSPATVIGPMEDNFPPIEPALHTDNDREQLTTLRQWGRENAQGLLKLIAQRKTDGWVRECHGDLHLGNVVLRNGHPLVFDCIEFSPELRWIDTISELAFITMDLDHRGHPGLANRFLNIYLEHSGDYAGLALLRLYQVYRTLVRAKVEAIREHQQSLDNAAQTAAPLCAYLKLADTYTQAKRPMLIITHGLSGSGKTTWTNALLEHLPASVRIRSDVERKRLHDLSPLDSSQSVGIEGGIYRPAANKATYEQLQSLARALLENGFTTIVEATFLVSTGRVPFRDIAADLHIPFIILSFQASMRTLEKRVIKRQQAERDASEAGLAVLHSQIDKQDILSPNELSSVITIDTESKPDIEVIAKLIVTKHL